MCNVYQLSGTRTSSQVCPLRYLSNGSCWYPECYCWVCKRYIDRSRDQPARQYTAHQWLERNSHAQQPPLIERLRNGRAFTSSTALPIWSTFTEWGTQWDIPWNPEHLHDDSTVRWHFHQLCRVQNPRAGEKPRTCQRCTSRRCALYRRVEWYWCVPVYWQHELSHGCSCYEKTERAIDVIDLEHALGPAEPGSTMDSPTAAVLPYCLAAAEIPAYLSAARAR